jgi:hypothetical protein
VRIAIERRSGKRRYASELSLTRAGSSGRNRIRFSGNKLPGGAYRATVVAKRDGDRSKRRSESFRVVR